MTAQQLAAHTDLSGRVLLGRYRILRELAKGGMGVVYLARVEGAVGFVKPVVIKLLLPEHMEDDRIVSMFVREARILAQLRHPSLVDVLEFGEQDGGYVLVLEYIRGYHLGLWLRYLAEKQRTASPDILLQITIDVLDALHHAHTQVHPDGSSMQIVHRDVSPSNILLDETGRGRLLDFGVARMRGGAQEYKTQVQGGFMGKLPYTAPEIFAGGEASPRSDLYACAVVLHEALFGRNMFRGETQAATLQRVLTLKPEPIEPINPAVPAGLDAVLERALAKTATDRQADARELALDLRKLQKEPEADVRARLADLLHEDFGAEMARLLNVESLAERDDAWRRLSVSNVGGSEQADKRQPPADAQRPVTGAGLAPAPAGATAVERGPRRGNTQGEQVAKPGDASAARAVLDQPDEPSATPALRRSGSSRSVPSPANDVAPRVSAEPRSAGTNDARRAPHGPGKRARSLYMSLAVGALLGVLGGAWLLLGAPGTSQLPAPHYGTGGDVPTLFHPAQPSPEVPDEPPPEPKPQPTHVAEPADEETDPDPPVEPTPDKTRRTSARANGPDGAALTRALRRQRSKLEACFNSHSVTLEGHATTQLIFDLAQDGSQTHLELSPPLLEQTELGQCLLRVARKTRFPPQPHAVSFAIPLTASTTKP